MHERMRLLQRFVIEQPGSTIQEAARALRLERQRLIHLLDAAPLASEIRLVTIKRRKFLVPGIPGIEDHIQQIRCLRDDALGRLYRLLQQRGPLACSKLQHVTAHWSWSPRTTRHRINRLVEVDLLRRVQNPHQDQRWTWYRAVPLTDAARQAMHTVNEAQRTPK